MHWMESIASYLEEPTLARPPTTSRTPAADDRYEEVVDRLTAVTPEVDRRINDAVDRDIESKRSR
jgi:hypothetical protein